MLLTTYGYKKPQTNDTGEIFFPAMEFNISRFDAHTHNGVDSAPLVTNSLVLTTQAIASSGWGSDLGGGLWKQTITLPSVGNGGTGGAAVQLAFDAISIEIRISGTKETVYPKIVKNATNKYDIYTNDPTQNWTALYTT